MPAFLHIGLTVLLALLAAAALLHAIPRLGGPGRALSEWLCRAPGLDLVITYFTAAPFVFGPAYAVRLHALGETAWTLHPVAVGLLATVAGQVVAVCIWTVAHELVHRDQLRGPRIVHTLNRKVGRFRNHAAVWWTALAVPIFWCIRVAEYIVYPPLTLLVRLPKYNDAEWINVSRHKFKGLVGHDLIWCLYCDWMTGVWSLGGEMLRNVETFWCPIRFDSAKKCENCKNDYPDIFGGWVPADGDMAEVTKRLDEQYPGPNGDNSWWGHPARLTVSAAKKNQPQMDTDADG